MARNRSYIKVGFYGYNWASSENGGTPIAGWFISWENPIVRNGWWLGVALWQNGNHQFFFCLNHPQWYSLSSAVWSWNPGLWLVWTWCVPKNIHGLMMFHRSKWPFLSGDHLSPGNPTELMGCWNISCFLRGNYHPKFHRGKKYPFENHLWRVPLVIYILNGFNWVCP